MNDPHSDFQLHSIERLRRTRRRRADAEAQAEPRSWAEGRDAHEASPYLSAGEPERRVCYDVLTSDAQRVAVTLSCEPVLDLRRGQWSSEYVREHRRPVGRVDDVDQVRALWPGAARRDDHELLDGLRFKRGLALLEAQGPGYGVMQTTWREVTESRPAFVALNQCLRARVDPHVRLIAELTDLPAGADRAEVAEVVAFLSERRRGVIVRLPPDAEALDAVAGAGFRGVSYSLAAPVMASFAVQWARLEALLRATRRAVPYVLVDQAKAEFGDKLREAGATHAVFTRFSGRLI